MVSLIAMVLFTREECMPKLYFNAIFEGAAIPPSPEGLGFPAVEG
jgi:hypothetical protein